MSITAPVTMLPSRDGDWPGGGYPSILASCYPCQWRFCLVRHGQQAGRRISEARKGAANIYDFTSVFGNFTHILDSKLTINVFKHTDGQVFAIII